jgi:subtilisin family serine protease
MANLPSPASHKPSDETQSGRPVIESIGGHTMPLNRIDLKTLGALKADPAKQIDPKPASGRRARVRPGTGRGATNVVATLPASLLDPRLATRRDAGLLRRLTRTYVRNTTFVIETKFPEKSQVVQDMVAQVLGAGAPGLPANALANAITVEPLFPGADHNDQQFKLAHFHLLTLPVRESVLQRALPRQNGGFFDIAYALKTACKFEYVTPNLRYPNQSGIVPLSSACSAGRALAPLDRAWSLRATGFDRLPLTANGAGVVIAHPDTGWTVHPQLNMSSFDLANDYNAINGTNDAQDPLLPGLPAGLSNPAHGTATASVMVSPGRVNPNRISGVVGPSGDLDASRGTTDPGSTDDTPRSVTGVAQGATILPIRALQGVVVTANSVDIARAIWHACQRNAHVISMSLGGPVPDRYLQAVIGHAVYVRNMIVVAAAGNCVEPVVFPARFPEVIAVGGSAISEDNLGRVVDRSWPHSSRGPAVVVSAPAENVWHASWNDTPSPVVVPGEGTSFAAPHVAGLAALWLQRNGRQTLLNTYPGVPLQHVFVELLRSTARRPIGWDTANFGAGIIDAPALLAAPLPPAASLPVWNGTFNFTPIAELICRGVAGMTCAQVRTRLTTMLNLAPAALDAWLAEYGLELQRNLLESEQAAQDFAAVLASTANEVQEAAEAVVDEIVDTVSDALATAAGWFGF